MIELVNFCKRYGKKVAVEDVSLTVNKGEITALLGENGAGKTTILKAICAVHKATSGKVIVSGREESEAIKEIVGYVPETPLLYSDFTVLEFLNFASDIRLLFGEKRKDAIERVLDCCKIESVLDKKIASLSKGYSQRVSFAIALLHDPEVLVLDESTSGLDPSQIKQMRALIKSLEKTKTILLSTHLMQEVDALAKKVFILKSGHLVASGTADSIAKENGCKTLEDAFIKLSGEN
jgi:ABC-2 type transport system ATP-binding protein